MNESNHAQGTWDKIKGFFERIGRRNLIIAGAVLVIGAAVVLNVIYFTRDKDEGFDYTNSAGMSTTYGTNLTNQPVGEQATQASADAGGTDAYFSSVEVSRKRARDEALEVLNAVVENDKATDEVKAGAMQEMQVLADEMTKEANIESILMSKGFSQALAVINGDTANIVVKNPGKLQADQLAQINAVVYEQTGILPTGITIVQKD